jgi:cell wall-associated NlpC family hydrolase
MSATIRRSLTHAVVLVSALLALTVAMDFSPVFAPRAEAMSMKARQQVVHIAASKRGTPYVYGASGPRAFDCSGFTRWVFARVGRQLPRTADAQSHAVRHVRASDRRPGDLVFFGSGHVYHVGIYAGGDSIWHSPRPGHSVHRERLWTHAVSYGRAR